MNEYQKQKEYAESINRQTDDGADNQIQQLAEAVRRMGEQIAEQQATIKELTKHVTRLEKNALQKPGRKKQAFTCPAFGYDHELTDEDLCDLVDEGYYDSIGKMERELGAHKNQLRNRINKARERRRMEREAVIDFGDD